MNIRQKNKWLIIGTVAFLILGYYVSIGETLSLRSNYQHLKSQEALFDNIPLRLSQLVRKEHYYDSLLVHHQITETSVQNNLLKVIDRYAEDHPIRVVSFDQAHKLESRDRSISSYVFRVDGDFKSILGLAYQLEQRNKFGMIASLEFEKQRNFRTGKTSLEGQFILQLVQ